MGEELADIMDPVFNRHDCPDFVPISEAVRITTQHWTQVRQLNLPIPVLTETHTRAIEQNQLTGEGSERGNEDQTMCENGDGAIGDDGVSEKKADDSSFFDCNICLELSKEPVLTCCGHLYCWPCLYQWLQISVAKECPVCKGEVTLKTVTPIYGSGNNKRELGDTKKIPMRPRARRIESLRNTTQMPPSTIPMEEVILERPPFTTPYEVIIRRNREASEREIRVASIMSGWRSMEVRSEQNQPSPAAAAMLAASRRRNDENGSRVPDVDSADSRPLRRRRITFIEG